VLEGTQFSDKGGLLLNDPALFDAEAFSARRPRHRGEPARHGPAA